VQSYQASEDMKVESPRWCSS